MSAAPARALLNWLVQFGSDGPTDAQRAAGSTVVVGEAKDSKGHVVGARLTAPEAYTLTGLTSVAIAQRVTNGEGKHGFQTPSLAFGPDFILEIPGTELADLEPRIPDTM